MKRFIILLFLIFVTAIGTTNSKDLEISREFTLFTSQQAAGYLKPLFTTIGESFNSGLYTNADYKPVWSIGLDITAMGMMIPNSQLNYNAMLPDLYGQPQHVKTASSKDGKLSENVGGYLAQPTIYGGRSQAVFAAPQNHFAPDSFYKSVAFVEGNNISLMSGLPAIQLVVGLPTRSQLRLRFFTFPLQGENLTYFGIGLNQNIDKLFNMFDDSTFSIAANLAYHSMRRNPGIEINSFAAGLHFGKYLGSGFTLSAGLQYEQFGGEFRAIKEETDLTELVNNPYPEIRNSQPLAFDIESFTNFRAGGGISFKYGILELHSSAYYASQPVLSAGMSIWLFESKEKVPEPEPIPEPEPEPVPIIVPEIIAIAETHVPEPEMVIAEPIITKLDADVQAFSVENGIEMPLLTINMEEKISRHISPLLPMIFFDDASASIPARYSQITNDSASRFVGSEIAEGTALDVYYSIMNVIGRRMIEHPRANITLTGTNSGQGTERNNTTLSRERADNVKNYLTNTWGIDPNRISIKSRNLPAKASNQKETDGIAENRRVEIASDTWEIIAPSVIQDTSRMILPAVIRFKQTANSDAGLNDWRLFVSSNTRQIKDLRGQGDIKPQIDWQVQEDDIIKALIRNNLQFNLAVADKEGNRFVTDIHSLPVITKTIDRETAASGDTITNLYDLILFDFDQSTLSQDNQRIINMIRSEMPGNSIIRVIGFTDRMGSEEYNQRLSLSRAKSAAKALGRSDAETIGSGKSVLLYNNDLPEGRFYSRTVIVEVKIPIN